MRKTQGGTLFIKKTRLGTQNTPEDPHLKKARGKTEEIAVMKTKENSQRALKK